MNDIAATEALINEKTRLVFVETIGNPALDVADIEAYAALAHRHGLPLVVDSTFTTPALLRPIEHGADIVIHSLSKWIGGHGAGIGGAVVDSGKFDWTNPKFALYNEPDAGYHGLRFAHDLPEPLRPVAFTLRLLTVGIRNQGPTLAPDAAWIFLQGVESLPLRIAKHSANALAVAKHLQSHPKVAWVKYPSLTQPELAAEGRLGGGAQVRGHPQRRDLLAAGERRRRQVARHPPGLDHALAALLRGPAQGRRPAGARPPLDRHRARR